MIRRFFTTERNMMIAIMLNAIVIFLLYFPNLKGNNVLHLMDLAFVLLFTIEAVVKIGELGFKNYFKNNWNTFDFILVVLSFPTLLGNLIPMQEMNIVLILRLFRLFRLVRFIQFIPHVDMLLAGLARAIRASVLVMIVLFGLNFLLALFCCHFYSEVSPEFFGNPLISCMSIFQMFTVEGWNEIPKVIGDAMSENGSGVVIIGLTKFFFVLIVLIGGIFGMSLANAVFVDEMTIDNNIELEKKIDVLQGQMEELKQLIQETKK